ncbi:putative reverse transcriptase domain-containing protein [Tanacetum coccineum]
MVGGVRLFIGLITLVGQVLSLEKIAKRGGRVWRGHGCQGVTRRCLEALELKGGDGGACKVLGWLLGDVMVMQGRWKFTLMKIAGCYITSSKPTNLSEAVRMVHKLMEQKSQVRKEREMEGNKRKWENFQSGNSSRCHKCGKVGHKSRYCKEKNVATGANAQPN